MSWSTGEPLYYEIIDLLLNSRRLTDTQVLNLASDLKLLFEKYDCDSISGAEVVNKVMNYYYD